MRAEHLGSRGTWTGKHRGRRQLRGSLQKRHGFAPQTVRPACQRVITYIVACVSLQCGAADVQCSATLRCASLCRAVLRCAVQRSAGLRCAALRCAVLRYAMPRYAMPGHAMRSSRAPG